MESTQDAEYEEKHILNENYVSIPYGFQNFGNYLHASKHCDIQSITYNSKNNEYVILDSRGVTGWIKNIVTNRTRRLLDFEAYKFNTLRDIIYCRAYNVYFALTKEYQLKVYNLNFHETFCVESDKTSISCLMFNYQRNELVTAGRNRLRFWKFDIVDKKKALQGLVLDREYPVADSSLISDSVLDEALQRVYLLCDSDIWCYSVKGRFIFHLKNTSTTFVSACVFSMAANLLIVAGLTGQISIYSTAGGLVTVLLNHSRAVTALLVHPSDGNMLISSSLDGTIKLFSLQMLEELYSINVFHDGVIWMAHRPNNILYCASRKSVQLFDLNYTFKFWNMIRSDVKTIDVLPKVCGKTSHVLACTKDHSIRLYSSKTCKKKCIVLPPPELSVLDDVLPIAYDRIGNVVYMLCNSAELWIYSTKSDPATRVAIWNIGQIIENSAINIFETTKRSSSCAEKEEFGVSSFSKSQADQNVKCMCLSTIAREVYDTSQSLSDGNISFLLCGLSNGTIVFLDPNDQGNVFTYFKAHSTCPVMEIRIDGNLMVALIQTIENLLIRIFDVKEFTVLQEFTIMRNMTVFAYKASIFAAGHENGQLLIQKFTELTPEMNLLGNQSERHSAKSSNEHSSNITSVDILKSKHLICSCGKDQYIRIWNENKVLLSELKLDESLSYGTFLNSAGDVLVGFKSQLFVIEHHIFQLPVQLDVNLDSTGSSGEESYVYEDPYLTKDIGGGLKESTLSNYLVPYPHLELQNLWMMNNPIAVVSDENADNEEHMSSSSIGSDESFARTEIYEDSLYSESISSIVITFPRCEDSPSPEFQDDISETITQDLKEQDRVEEVQEVRNIDNHVLFDKVKYADMGISERIKSLLDKSGQLEGKSQIQQDNYKKNSRVKKQNRSTQNRFADKSVKKKVIKKKVKKSKIMPKKSQNKDVSEDEKYAFEDKEAPLRDPEVSYPTIASSDDDNKNDSTASLRGDVELYDNDKVHDGDKVSDDDEALDDDDCSDTYTEDQLHSEIGVLPENRSVSVGPLSSVSNKSDGIQSFDPNNTLTETEAKNNTPPSCHSIFLSGSLSDRALGVSNKSVSLAFQNVINSLIGQSKPEKAIKEQVEEIYNESYWDEEVEIMNQSDSIINEDLDDIHSTASTTYINSPASNNTNRRDNRNINNSKSKTTLQMSTMKKRGDHKPRYVGKSLSSKPKKSVPKETPDTNKAGRNKNNKKMVHQSLYNMKNNFNEDISATTDDSSVPLFGVTVTHKINPSTETSSVVTEHPIEDKYGSSTSIHGSHKYPMALKTVRFSDNLPVGKQHIEINTETGKSSKDCVVGSASSGATQPTASIKTNIKKPIGSTNVTSTEHSLIMVLNAKRKQYKLKTKNETHEDITTDSKNKKQVVIQETKSMDSIISSVSSANIISIDKDMLRTEGNDEHNTEKEREENDDFIFMDDIYVEEQHNNRKDMFGAQKNNACISRVGDNMLYSEYIESTQYSDLSLSSGVETQLNDFRNSMIEPDGNIEERPKDVVKQQLMKFILSAFNKSKSTLSPRKHLAPTCATSYVTPQATQQHHATPDMIPTKNDVTPYQTPVLCENDMTATKHGENDPENDPNLLSHDGNTTFADDCVNNNSSNLLSLDGNTKFADDCFNNNSSDTVLEQEEHSFITPMNSFDDFQPIKRVMITTKNSTDADLIRSNSMLFEKLSKHRYFSQKEQYRHHSAQMRRSRCSSGYDASSGYGTSPDSYLQRYSADLASSKQRLTIRNSPVHTRHLEDSKSYIRDLYSYTKPKLLKTPSSQERINLSKHERLEKIKNLEEKLSGQPHRFHYAKTAEQIENDRVALLFLKAKESGFGLLPVTKKSVSIPNRCEFQLDTDIKPTPPAEKRKYSRRYRTVSGN